jgi:hypothetical protein
MLIGVPFHVVIETDGEDLLLSLLHISGNDLHSFIQQERLRWSVFCIVLCTNFCFRPYVCLPNNQIPMCSVLVKR